MDYLRNTGNEQIASNNVYQRGARLKSRTESSFAEIYKMKEKPGWIAKEIPFKIDAKRGIPTFEQFQLEVENSSALLKKYLSEFLPKYEYQFFKNNEHPNGAVVYFTEMIQPMRGNQPSPAAEIESFMQACAKMYSDTWKPESYSGTAPDVNERNIMFGRPENTPDARPRTYFIDFFPIEHGMHKAELQVRLNELASKYHTPLNETSLLFEKLTHLED